VREYTGSSSEPFNHRETPPPTDRQRWVFWLCFIGFIVFVSIINK